MEQGTEVTYAGVAPYVLDETAFIKSCLLGGTASPSPWTAASVPHPAGVVGPHRDLDPVASADLGQQARDVGLGGRQADEEIGGDLGVRAATGHQLQHLLLAVGERLDRLGTSARRFPGGEGGQQPPGDVRRDQG